MGVGTTLLYAAAPPTEAKKKNGHNITTITGTPRYFSCAASRCFQFPAPHNRNHHNTAARPC